MTQDTLNLASDALVATASATPRSPFEEFVWMGSVWDIARFWRDIDAGKLKPKLETLEEEFIEGYAKGVLLVDKDAAPGAPQRVSFLMRVDVERARGLPAAALDVPVVIVRTRKGKGIISFSDEGPCHLLADGNHRIAKAHITRTKTLRAYVLTPRESKAYQLR